MTVTGSPCIRNARNRVEIDGKAGERSIRSSGTGVDLRGCSEHESVADKPTNNSPTSHKGAGSWDNSSFS